jgi:uncharacterized membrane-anchored protein YhcB (DUF1043 family)
MIKASRVLFVIGILFALFGCVSAYITLTSGGKMMEQASSFAQNDEMRARLEKAKSQIEEWKAKLPLHIAELAAGVAGGALGFAGTKARRRNGAFFALEALCLICVIAVLASKSWLVGCAYLVALALGFIQIMRLTKGGAVIPEE